MQLCQYYDILCYNLYLMYILFVFVSHIDYVTICMCRIHGHHATSTHSQRNPLKSMRWHVTPPFFSHPSRFIFFLCGKRNLNPTGTHRSHGTCCSQGCQMACVLWSGVDVFEKDPGHSLTPLLYRAVDSYSYMDGTGWPSTSTYLQFTKEKATQKIPKVF